MPHYIMFAKLNVPTFKSLKREPDTMARLRDTLERWEVKILADYHLLGKYDFCVIFEAPDNFRAHRAVLQQDLTAAAATAIYPAIDMPLFQRLIEQSAETVGPHRWQTQAWAKAARVSMRWYAYSRWVWRYCKPLTVTGQENLKRLRGPCIVIGNHSSHMDSLVLFQALPQRIKWNIYFGAAADRWFITGRKGATKQPWYQSLVMGSFPIHRGGGSQALDYSKELLRKGCSLAIFPEGTRSSSRKMARFRHGVSILALEHNVPVVPVYLSGLRELRPKGSRVITPGPAGAQILPPVYFPAGTTVPQATKMLFDVMNAAHEKEMRRRHGAAAPVQVENASAPAPA